MNMNQHPSKFLHRTPLIAGMLGGACMLLAIGCKPAEPTLYPQEQLTVNWEFPAKAIRVGDPVELVVTAYFPTNGLLELPEVGRKKEIVLLSQSGKNSPRKDGLTQIETRFSITSFRLGEHQISTNNILCRVGEQTLSTPFPKVVLRVETVLNETANSELADIKPMHRLPGRIPRWIWVLLGTAAIAFLIGWISTKVWKHREKIIPTAPPIPPHVIALKALQHLKEKGLLEKNQCNPFYTELSLILREYLEGRFKLNATDETTEEIVEAMSQSPELTRMQRTILQEFMRQADMVKFAKGRPDRATMESAFLTTKQFIEETKKEGLGPTT